MKRVRLALLLALAAGAIFLAQGVVAAELTAREIMEKVDARDDGDNSTATLEMILIDKRGDERVRRVNRSTKDKGRDMQSVLFFLAPADVRGTGFLTYDYYSGERDDDQWLYLPALGRVKRIASSNKSGPFMGSEFSYEDLSSPEVEKYNYVYLGDETFDGREHFVLQRTPQDTRSGYRRMVVWLDKTHYRAFKIDYYDRRNTLLKTLTAEGFTLYGDRHWRATSMLMVNHQNGRSTGLQWTDYVFSNGYTEADFNRNNLSKIR